MNTLFYSILFFDTSYDPKFKWYQKVYRKSLLPFVLQAAQFSSPETVNVFFLFVSCTFFSELFYQQAHLSESIYTYTRMYIVFPFYINDNISDT